MFMAFRYLPLYRCPVVPVLVSQAKYTTYRKVDFEKLQRDVEIYKDECTNFSSFRNARYDEKEFAELREKMNLLMNEFEQHKKECKLHQDELKKYFEKAEQYRMDEDVRFTPLL